MTSTIQSTTVDRWKKWDSLNFGWPLLGGASCGHPYWELSEPQAKRLREYLDRGGFLMVDDFHRSWEWGAFSDGLRKVFPDRPVVDLADEGAIFHTLYNLDERFQVPGRRYIRSGRTYEQDGVEPRWRAIFDEHGRVQVAICHNMDLGDAWEGAGDPRYPEPFTALAYRIGINYIVYAMTHGGMARLDFKGGLRPRRLAARIVAQAFLPAVPAFLPEYGDRKTQAAVDSALRPQECGRGSLKGHATNCDCPGISN